MADNLKIIIFPGWAVPVDLYAEAFRNLSHDYLVEIIDFGYFSPDKESIHNVLNNLIQLDYSNSVIIGHSLGAYMALTVAGKKNGLRGLVLFAPFMKFCAGNGLAGQSPDKIDAMETQLKKKPESLLRSFYRTMSYPGKFKIEVPQNLNIKNLLEGLHMLKDSDCSSIAGSVSSPALVFHGSDDAIVSEQMVKEVVSSISRREYVKYENCGHSLPFENSGVCDKINTFINEKGSNIK